MKTNTNKGNLFVVSAPSGAGKTTLCQKLFKELPGIEFSVSHTTRKPREGEVHGRDYYFVSVSEFKEKIDQSEMLEWAEVHGNYYGTSKQFVTDKLNAGIDILLDIDVQGAHQVKKLIPEVITVFIMPPSLDDLSERLNRRGTDTKEVIQKRLGNALTEMREKDWYDFVIINDDLETAASEFISLLKKHRNP